VTARWLALALALAACKPIRKSGSCDGPCPASKINHLVVVVQENHTFDNWFAQYCTAASGSAPTCTAGPGCCEAGPDHEPGGAAPMVLDDTANGARDPDHSMACELAETNGGKVDRYVAGVANCSDPGNFAYADPTLAQQYWDMAAGGALADRYFQPIAGQSASNDMFLFRGGFVFPDNQYEPDAIGKECGVVSRTMTFDGPTLGDLLDARGVSWAWYVEGYDDMVAARAKGSCPDPPDLCGSKLSIYPCVFDPIDLPIDYYANSKDNPQHLHDLTQYVKDIDADKLPQVIFIKGLGFRSEHPGQGTTLSLGVDLSQEATDALLVTDYGPDGLALVTWDEGGGFFDHVAPPAAARADGQPYGTRVPLIARGPFARVNSISHVTLEHSSIVKFIEWNWLGMQTGQLGARDAEVNNLGSLLDPSKTGVAVPE
jgi:phospholipase C